MTWEPDIREGEREPVESAVYQALGAASTCWDPRPAGVFDSTKAKDIGEGLMAYLEGSGGPARLARREHLTRAEAHLSAVNATVRQLFDAESDENMASLMRDDATRVGLATNIGSGLIHALLATAYGRDRA